MKLALTGFLAVAVAIVAVAAVPAGPVGQVRDDARFFSPDAVAQANGQIQRMYWRFYRDVLVETFAEPPASVKGASKSDRERSFEDWARQRMVANKVSGVMILVSRNPAHLQIAVGPETTLRAFTPEDRKRLQEQLLTDFRARQFDKGLLEAVGGIHKALEKNLGAGPATRPAAAPATQPGQGSPLPDAGGMF